MMHDDDDDRGYDLADMMSGARPLPSRIDLEKCANYGVRAADVNNVIQCAVGGQAMTTMIEGEKSFDVTIRWPKGRRGWRRRTADGTRGSPLASDQTNSRYLITAPPDRRTPAAPKGPEAVVRDDPAAATPPGPAATLPAEAWV